MKPSLKRPTLRPLSVRFASPESAFRALVRHSRPPVLRPPPTAKLAPRINPR